MFRRQTVVAEEVAGLPDKRLLVREAKDAHRDGTTGAHGVCDELAESAVDAAILCSCLTLIWVGFVFISPDAFKYGINVT